MLFDSSYLDGLTSWHTVQQPAGAVRVTTVANPAPSDSVEPSPEVMRSELDPGDLTDTGGYIAPRAEVYGRSPTFMTSTPPAQWPDPVGSTRWYSFSVFLPVGFPTATDDSWLVLTQWKGQYGGSPPISLELQRNRFRLGGSRSNDGRIAKDDLGAIKFGRWTRFVFGITWGTTPSSGFLHVERDGVVYANQALATMDTYNGAPDPIYLKQGIYRDKAFAVTQVAYYGPMVVGTTRDDVVTTSGAGGSAPTPTPTPPPGIPTPTPPLGSNQPPANGPTGPAQPPAGQNPAPTTPAVGGSTPDANNTLSATMSAEAFARFRAALIAAAFRYWANQGAPAASTPTPKPRPKVSAGAAIIAAASAHIAPIRLARRDQRCPSKVRLAIRGGGTTVRKRVGVRSEGGSCVTATVALPVAMSQESAVTVTVTGHGLNRATLRTRVRTR